MRKKHLFSTIAYSIASTRTLLTLMIFLAMPLMANAQELNPKKFCVDVNMMIPMSFPPKTVYDYSLEVKNDSLFLTLPYIGELHTPPMNNDGLNFNTPITNFKVKQGKKDSSIISFKARHNALTLEFTVTIFSNESADIFMLRSDGQSCSYSGSIRKEEGK